MRQTLTTLTILICLTTYGQVDIKEVNKNLTKTSEMLYASKFEVSNQLYSTFIHSLKKAKKDNLLSIARIDSTQWLNKDAYNKPYVDYYHIHPAFKDYPVVNISYDAAVLFCKWLTDEYNSSPKRKFKKVIFRLPTEKEWTIAAKGGNESAIFSWEGNDVKDKKGNYRCNMLRTGQGSIGNTNNLNGVVFISLSVKSFVPNKFGLYNMCGNVAEMLDDKNIVKGGSWLDPIEEIKIGSKKTYDGSAKPWVGFRYFVEIIEK